MAEKSHQLVQKLWNYCNILRDDLSAHACHCVAVGRCNAQAGRLSYLLARGLSALVAQAGAQASGDYPSAWSILSPVEGLRTGSEQVTSLLFFGKG